MHNLISIIRCEFVSVSNIQQKYMHRFSLNFQDRSNIAQETTWGILRMFQTTMQMCVNVYVLYMCVVGVGVLVGRGGGGWVGMGCCFVSGYTNFIHFLFCFYPNHKTCYNQPYSQQHFTCIMLTKISDDYLYGVGVGGAW